METEPGGTNVSQRETLLLISHYLRSLPIDSQALDRLQQSLTDNGLLGDVPTWQGGTRRATIDDMLRVNQQLPANHLLKCLQLAATNTDAASSGSDQRQASLLQITANPSPEQLSVKLRAFTDKLSEVHEAQAHQREYRQRQAEIEARIGSLTEGTNDLQEAGLGRESDRIDAELGRLDVQLHSAEKEFQATLGWLRAAGAVLTSLHRPKIDSTPAAIMQREYFGSRLGGARANHRLGKGGLSSLDGVEFCLKYRKLFMVHGHIFNPAYCVIFDQSGRFVISGADDFLIKIWDVQSGLQARVLKGHTSHISYLAVSADNAMLASASTDCTVRLWRIKDGYPLARLWHDAAVNWIKFDPVTGGLVSAADDGSCKVWDVANLLQDELGGLPLLELSVADNEVANTAALNSNPAVVGWQSTPEDEPTTNHGGQMDTIGPRPVTPMLAASPSTARGSVALEVGEQGVHRRHRTRSSTDTVAGAFADASEALGFGGADGVQPQRLVEMLPVPDVYGPTTYDWTQTHGNVLILPHNNPAAQAQGEDRTTRVMCVDFCPIGGLFVTGSDDASARVWQTRSNAWNKLNVMDFGEKSDSRRQALAAGGRQAGYFLVCKLQGHLASVTDVRFSHLGDRILTASQNDGTVRIWTFARNFSQLNHIVLHLNADLDGSDDGPAMGARNRASRRRKQIEVYNVAWSSDDRWVFTLQSFPKPHEPGHSSHSSSREVDARLKVWDSFSGVLHHVVEVAHGRCVVLAPHPSNPSIIVTGGEDGVIAVWNVFKETCLLRHSMFHTGPERFGYVNGDAIAAVDGAFSPDGSRFCISDKFGRVTVFGLEDAEPYKQHLEEQLFSTDYQEVLIDNDGRAIDPGTNLPTHVSPTGALMNFAGTAYDPQPRRPLCPSARSLQDMRVERFQLLQAAKTLDAAMQEAYIYSARARSRAGRESSRLLSKTGTGPKHRPAHSAGASTRHRATNRYATMNDINARAESYVFDDADADGDELDAFSSGSELDWGEQAHHNHNLRQRAAVRPRTQGRTTRNSRRVEEGWEEFQAELAQPRRNLRRTARTGHVVDEDSDFDDNDDPELQAALAESQRTQLSSNARGRRAAAPRRVRDAGLPTICDFGDNVSREWLWATEQSPVEYVPQLGDIVMYLPQGHSEHLSMFPETTAPPWQSFPRKWAIAVCKVVGISYDFPSAEAFQRSDSTVCHVELQLLKFPPDLDRECQFLRDYLPRPGRLIRDESTTFKVSMHRASLAEFLVLHHVYERSALFPWEVDSPFVAEFVEYTATGEKEIRSYNGRINGISDENPRDWPHSPWELFEVSWEGPDTETGYNRINPWEAKPVTSGELQQKIDSITGPALDEELTARLLHAIRQVEETTAAQPFASPVPVEVPLYYKQIPLPMDLGTIAARLDRGYYRQIEAFQHDVKLILQNCQTFNVDDSPIVHAAVEVTTVLLDAVTTDQSVPDRRGEEGVQGSARALRRQQSSSSTANQDGGRPHARNLSTSRDQASEHSNSNEQRSDSDDSDAFEDESDSDGSNDDKDTDSDDSDDGGASRKPRRGSSTRQSRSSQEHESRRRSKRPRRSTRALWDDGENASDAHSEEDEEDSERTSRRKSRRRRQDERKSKRKEKRANGKRPRKPSRHVVDDADGGDDAVAESSTTSRRASRRSMSAHNDYASSEAATSSTAVQRATRSSNRADTSAGADEIDESSFTGGRPRRSVKRARRLDEEDSDEDAGHEVVRKSSRARTPSAAAIEASSSSTATSSRRVRTREEMHKMQALLEHIGEIDTPGLFADPVTEDVAPHYFEIVAEPMDRQLIEVNLASNVYNSLQDMIAHCELMYNNCLEYNDSKSSIAKEARRQQKLMRDFVRHL